jgi:hypothetical protein
LHIPVEPISALRVEPTDEVRALIRTPVAIHHDVLEHDRQPRARREEPLADLRNGEAELGDPRYARGDMTPCCTNVGDFELGAVARPPERPHRIAPANSELHSLDQLLTVTRLHE